MKEELIIKILTQSSKFLSQEQIRKLRYILDGELYQYTLTTNCTDIVPINDLNNNIALFIADKKYVQECSHNTIDGYFRILNKFAKTIQKNVDKIDTMDIRRYIALLSQSGLKKSSISSHIWCLKSFFNWLVQNDKIIKNPTIPIKAPKFDKKSRKSLSTKEFEALRFSCKSLREKALVEAVFSMGSRLAEFQKLNINDIDWNTGKVSVLGKGNKAREVYLNERARLYLKKYIESRNDNNPALFVTERSPHNRLGRRGIQRVFHNLGVRANIKQNVFPHIIRHNTATILLNNQTPIHLVAKYLGHEDINTTKIYTEMNQDEVRINWQRCLNQ